MNRTVWRLLALTLALPILLTACTGAPTDSASSKPASSASASASVSARSDGVSAADGASSATVTGETVSEGADSGQAAASSPASSTSSKTSSAATSSKATSSKTSSAATSSKATSSKTSSAATSSKATSSKTSSAATSSKATSSTPAVVKFTLPFKRGVNLSGLESGTYSSSIFSGNAYLGKDSTYTVIKSKGFDHVRLPVDLRNYYNAGTKTLKSGISDLDMILDKIEAAGLYCCLDFHGWYNLNTSDASQKETFLTIWRLIAERYKNRSDKLCFELINEPHDNEGGNLNIANLNALQAEVIPLIRKTNPNRIILAAAAEWDGAWTLDRMVLPTDDGHLAIVCHTYAPMAFTHQGASWAGYGSDQVHFSVTDKSATGTKDLDNAFTWIRRWEERTGIPVILNEFGVYTANKADHGEITAWLTYVTDKCKANNVSWTYWEFNKGFGVYQNNKWVDYILEGLGMN